MYAIRGDLYVALVTVIAVLVTGIISFLIIRRQVRNENKNTLRRLKEQYNNVIRQIREETNVMKYRKLNEQKIEALQRCWGLLIYSTKLGNNKSIIICNEVQQKENKEKTVEKTEYFFSKKQIDEFINALQQFYFIDGWGMYLSDELKNLLFEYRSRLFNLKLTESENENDIVKFKNSRIATALLKWHSCIVNVLQKEMMIYFNLDTQENTH
jgi:hypothetical protein